MICCDVKSPSGAEAERMIDMPDIFSMEPNEILQKKRALLRELSAGADVFTPVRVALLSGSTVGEIENILRLYLLAYGIKPEFFVGQFDRYYEEAVFGDAGLVAFAPEIVYIHTSSRNLGIPPSDEVYEKLEQVWDKLGMTVIQNNFEMPPYRVMGNRDCSGGGLWQVAALNRRIAEYANAHSRFYINDIHYLSAWFGLERWFDDAGWYMYKYAMSLEALPLLCGNIAKIIKSLLGKNRKALAVDLDNTLWGGVVGDDGAAALEQTPDTPKGMAFSDFQKYLKAVSALGIPLNVVSKNSGEAALSGLEGALLKREDFLCFCANWDNKDENIRKIARELNIGTDAVVFVDDNPAERDLVRRFVPDAAAPEFGAPESYIRALDRMGYFEVTALSEDDQKRVEYYKTGQERKSAEGNFADYTEYLLSLDMKACFEPVNAGNLQRAAQLINKTNQFNLTARRFLETEVAAMAADPDTVTVCGRLSDKYGDNGLVTVLTAGLSGDIAEIGLWVMSCRVFKRGLEYAALYHLLRLLKARGVKTVRGVYLPTEKNKYVENLYQSLGFSSENGTDWTAGIDEIVVPPYYMEVV